MRSLKLARRRASLTLAIVGTAIAGLFAHRMRAFLSTLGIAIGVATLTTIYALTQGLSHTFAAQLSALGSDTLYVTRRPWVIRGDWWKYRNRPPITRSDVLALRREGALLQAVAPVGFAAAEVKSRNDRMSLVQVRGTTSEYIDTSNLKLSVGRFLSPLEGEQEQPVAVVGSEIQERLFKGASAVGDYVYVGNARFTVVGVLMAQGKAFGQSQDALVIMPLGAFERLFGFRRDLAIAVSARPEELHRAEDQVTEILRRRRGLSADKEATFAVNRQSELMRLFSEQTSALFGVAIAIGLITLLVGGIGVMNIMMVAVTERTREIGVRRALGARRRTILLQFLVEASLVTALGGALGVALGGLGAQILDRLSPIPGDLSLEAALGGVAFSALVGLLFGSWPASRAARLDPIESLRYE